MDAIASFAFNHPLLAIAIWFGVVFTVFGSFERRTGLREPT
jgi:hypothetical protein